MVEHGPSRVVDSRDYGWFLTGDGAGNIGYRFDWGQYGTPLLGMAELDRGHGPLRPVEPITDADSAILRDALRRAGRKAVTTLAAAIEEVFHHRREDHGGLHAGDSYEAAKRALTAGRGGSNESHMLMEVMLIGNGLNLVRLKGVRMPSVERMRAAGPHRRVDAAVRAILADLIHRWVTDPTRYTEVAETLAAEVSRFADDTAGPDGWRAIADQWLQPGSLGWRDGYTCHLLFYSLSEHHNPDLYAADLMKPKR